MSNTDQTPHQKRRGDYIINAERERENDERYEDLENEFQAGKRDWREVEKKFNLQINELREELGRYQRRLDDVSNQLRVTERTKLDLETELYFKKREIAELNEKVAKSEKNTYDYQRTRANLDVMAQYIEESRARWVEEDRRNKWDGFVAKDTWGRSFLVLKWGHLLWEAASGIAQFVLAIRGEKRASKEE
ncbi:hypothetical protein BGAL_0793g00010 [Botrytis galanthina]|uniref:Uncharacterized protein n=1 Tax=Botrytis galanthina TaxID=278940 RepID=A0A4S8QHG9_9HELO|nr:hypothetical protein BGAL_0793g00010 [Botrytis galanthina]